MKDARIHAGPVVDRHGASSWGTGQCPREDYSQFAPVLGTLRHSESSQSEANGANSQAASSWTAAWDAANTASAAPAVTGTVVPAVGNTTVGLGRGAVGVVNPKSGRAGTAGCLVSSKLDASDAKG